MRRLIFLDIDGVLNSAQFIATQTGGEGVVIVDGEFDATHHLDPLRVARLNRLVAATSAEVILSSSWRVLFGVEKTQRSLVARGFAHALADATVRLPGEPRHVEIQSYLSGISEPFAHVVLDDATEAAQGADPCFVLVDDGLEDHHVDTAIRFLGHQR
jgi:hypothetical protein